MRELEKIMRGDYDNSRGIHIFSNRRRRDIFRELTRFPCSTSSHLSRNLGMDVRDVEWHLKKLESKGYVFSWKKNKKYYCVRGLVMEEDLPLFSLLDKRGMRKLLHGVIYGCREISSFGIKKSTIYRHIKQLSAMGLITVVGERRRIICPTEKLREITEKYDEVGRAYKRLILEKLEMPGYEIEVMGTIDYEMKIRISGVENFGMGIFISPLRTMLEG